MAKFPSGIDTANNEHAVVRPVLAETHRAFDAAELLVKRLAS